MAYRMNSTRVSKTVVLGALAFWVIIVMLMMAMISGLYFHWQLGKVIDKYVWEHRCLQIENTNTWICDDGTIEL